MPDIYISRPQEQLHSILQKLDSARLSVHCSAQITRTNIPFELPSKAFEWVFFSSPFAVEAFFHDPMNLPAVRWGAIGPGTAKALLPFVQPEYVGAGTNTDEIALEFLGLAGQSMVLFPSPEKGLRKVQSAFPPEQVIELICYKTSLQPTPVPACKLYVFSSPSNVNGFFLANELPASTPCIAFGQSTAAVLTSKGMHQIHVLGGLHDDDLLEAIFAKFVS